LSGAGQRVPWTSQHAAEEAKGRRAAQRATCLARTAPFPVSARICVEPTKAEYKQWRPLQRFTGRRESYTETHLAIAGLRSDRPPGAQPVTSRAPNCARAAHLLLIIHQPDRQADTPRPHHSEGRKHREASYPPGAIT
jgi:hypothetical protein